ncbi:hypothetical protein [Nocardia sp. NPDC052566]|uniref:hypothetical protein n=1 Tax=Nocardia sp. NPDC052566 TaxID=3364330 RepID=UPI0037CAC6BB
MIKKAVIAAAIAFAAVASAGAGLANAGPEDPCWNGCSVPFHEDCVPLTGCTLPQWAPFDPNNIDRNGALPPDPTWDQAAGPEPASTEQHY